MEKVVTAALDTWGGVVYIDVQPDYGDAEKNLAPLLLKRRQDIFIATKTWEQSESAVLVSVQESLRRLGVSYVDAILLNNIGMFDFERLFRPEGALAGLRKAQKQGLMRYIGISGHMGTSVIARALESGEFDIVMPVINFVDRHTYNFEEKVLPIAAKHNVGIVAMKVLGGAISWDYSTRSQRALLTGIDYRPAIHYALGVTGVSAAVIGCKTVEEVQSAMEAARSYRQINRKRDVAIMERGKELAAQWGEHFGSP
jgi:predicted aldo/keto reductase-like oxidoreductase